MMFRELRRWKQGLSREKAMEILIRNTSGTLAIMGEDEYPYAVPLSYVCVDDKLYFHSSKDGYKMEMIKKHEKASFCVIDQDEIVPEKFTTHYRSVIVFGKTRLLEDPTEMRRIAAALGMKYSADYKDKIPAEIDAYMKRLAIIEMTIEHITAKESLGLMNQSANTGENISGSPS